jgi:Spy/CpxP family protein refolding chaperone
MADIVRIFRLAGQFERTLVARAVSRHLDSDDHPFPEMGHRSYREEIMMRRLGGPAFLIAACLVSAASAQSPGTRPDFSKTRRENLANWAGPIPLSKPDLLSGGMCDALLNLNDDQRARIREIFDAKNRQMMELLDQQRARNSAEPFEPGNPRQKAVALADGQAMAALRERLGQEAEQEIKAVLEPKQWQRLEDLRLQFNGPQAFLQPEVQERLHLDEGQIKAIEEAVARARREMSQAMVPGGPGAPLQKGAANTLQARRLEASKSFRIDASRAISGILTEAQRAAYEKMLGKPYDKEAFMRGESESPKQE